MIGEIVINAPKDEQFKTDFCTSFLDNIDKDISSRVKKQPQTGYSPKAGDTLYFACGKYDVDNYTKSDDKETYVMNPTFTFEDSKTLEEFSFSTLYSSPEQAK